jgi:ankyrin repeat protein
MSNQALFVPVEESIGDAAGHTSLSISLYQVAAYPADQKDAWTINGIGPSDIQEKIKAYFKLYPDSQDRPAQLRMNNPKPFLNFTGSTQSITLGLFIGFMRFLRYRELRSGWDTVTLTGDLRPHGDRVCLYPVEHIKEKYAGVQAYAKDYPGQRHLFLYVSDEDPPPVPEGRRGNVEVRAFNSRHAFGALLAFLFEPFFNDVQRRFIDAAGLYCAWDYVPTTVFEGLKEAALAEGWQGFFIHGEGESGKSAMALELTKYLMNAGRIYAPVWVTIDNERLQEYIQNPARESAGKHGKEKERLTDTIAAYIAELAASNLQITDWAHEKGFAPLAQALSRDGGIPYLFVVDNLELDLADEVLEAVQKIAGRSKQKVPVILTSRIRGSSASLKTVSPSELNTDEIEQLVLNIARGQEYEQDLKTWKGTDEYREFIEQLHRHFGSFPGIIPVIAGHLYLGLPAILRTIAVTGGDIFARAETIYQMAYELLDIYARIVLFAFIGVTKPWMGFGQNESLKKHSPDFSGQDGDLSISQKIANHINKSRIRVDGRRLEIWEIEEKIPIALEQLQRRHILYRAGSGNEAQDSRGYYLKSLPLKIFLFSEVVGNEKTADAGKTLRDMLIHISDIIKACIYYNQSPSRLEALLKKNDDRGHRDYFLYVAASYSAIPAHIDLLVSHGYKNINKASWIAGRNTPLHFAADKNPNKDVIAKLLSYKANINARDMEGKTPLHLAAQYNQNPAVVSLLLDKGACQNAPDNVGETPVYYAVWNENSDIFKLFIERNPDLLYIPNSDGVTPLHYFAMYGRDPTIISWLLDRGVNINTPGPTEGSTLLHYAALNANEAVFLEFLNKDADIQVRDSEGSTVFHYAAMNTWICRMEQDIFAVLLNKGLSIHATNVNGMTPLHFAVANNGSSGAVELLMKSGANKDINARIIDTGATPLHCAAALNKAPIISVLIANGANIHVAAANGTQPIHSAAGNNAEPDVISVLLANGANVNADDGSGRTPLHYAAHGNESTQVVVSLIQAGANLEEEDYEGKTPLYYLKRRKDWSFIKRYI